MPLLHNPDHAGHSGRVHRTRTTLAVVALAALVSTSAPSAPAVASGGSPTGPSVARVASPAATSDEASQRTIRLGGVKVRLRPGTRQAITVNHSTGWHARVSFWRKTEASGWNRVAGTRAGRTGYGGLVPGPKREQGTGTTPLGSYRMTESFGLAKRPGGTALPFHRVRTGDYWVQDNASRYYNQLRNKRQGGFRWRLDGYNSSERLKDYVGQYRWSVVIDFNRPHPVRHRGSGIFLHVNGDGATAGCVSTPKPFVRQAMQRLTPRLKPVIAIGR